jgi:hypothetical protein
MPIPHKVARWLVLISSLLSCSTFANTDPCAPLTKEKISKNKKFADDASKYAIYAILSNNAYSRSKPIPLPTGWSEVTELRKDNIETGLAYAVYELHNDSKLVEVVVAFRGTDQLKDWRQNLLPIYRNQITPAEEAFDSILDRYKVTNAKIVATGHSLGGGLAFHMSFTHPFIDAIGFNSSPVTKAGFHPILSNIQVSVWESGEAIQAVRNIINMTRKRWQHVKRVEFRFTHGLPVGQHGMEELAYNMVKLSALESKSQKAYLESICQK